MIEGLKHVSEETQWRMLNSTRPAALAFQQVLYNEVLPAIARYGAWPRPDAATGAPTPEGRSQARAFQELIEQALQECRYPVVAK